MDNQFNQNQKKNSGFTCESQKLKDMIEYLKSIDVLSSDFDINKYVRNGKFDYDTDIIHIYENVPVHIIDPEEDEEIRAKEEEKFKRKEESKLSQENEVSYKLSKSAQGYKSRPNNLMTYVKNMVEKNGSYDSEDDFIYDVKNYFLKYDGKNYAIHEVIQFFKDKPEKLNEWIKTTVAKRVEETNPGIVIFKDDSIKDSKCNDMFEPISSFKSFEFLDKTKQGATIISAFRDLHDDRMHIIAKIPSDSSYFIGLGYSPEDGTWNQGRYDYPSYRSALKDLMADYNVEVYDHRLEEEHLNDCDEEVVIKKDSRNINRGLTFRRGR